MAEKLVSALQQEYTANSEEFFPPSRLFAALSLLRFPWLCGRGVDGGQRDDGPQYVGQELGRPVRSGFGKLSVSWWRRRIEREPTD